MVSVIYIALAGLLIVKLSLNVIALRRQHRVSVGDGGHEALMLAIRTQANATEYLPIALLLLVGLELNHAPKLLLHGLGILLLAGRCLHAFGLSKSVMNYRVLGMQITLFWIIGVAVLNLVFLPFDALFAAG